jgi:hypothetical protein
MVRVVRESHPTLQRSSEARYHLRDQVLLNLSGADLHDSDVAILRPKSFPSATGTGEFSAFGEISAFSGDFLATIGRPKAAPATDSKFSRLAGFPAAL